LKRYDNIEEIQWNQKRLLKKEEEIAIRKEKKEKTGEEGKKGIETQVSAEFISQFEDGGKEVDKSKKVVVFKRGITYRLGKKA